MSSPTTAAAKIARRPRTARSLTEPVVVRIRPDLGANALSVFFKEHNGFTLRAGQVVELDPATDGGLIEALRQWPMFDGPGCAFGEASFRPRHEVVSRSVWDERVASARSRLTESARIAADAAALTAAQREVAKSGDASDLDVVNARVSRRRAS